MMLPVKRMIWPSIPPVFTIGDEVTVVGGRWAGLNGIVVHETRLRVVVVNNAGFRHWFSLSDASKTYGTYW